MSLASLSVSNIRNISTAGLELSPGVNLVAGANGSGKTSLLESIYFLSTARTFRSASVDPLIKRNEPYCLARGELTDGRGLAVQRYRTGEKALRIGGEVVSRTSELAHVLPVLVLGPDSVNLLLDGPEGRRRFLNWGVFHVKHAQSFVGLWERANRCLRQRNELLRQPGSTPSELNVWTEEFVTHCESIDSQRSEYMTRFADRFLANCQRFMDSAEITVDYRPGWTGSLSEALSRDLENDLKRGYTQRGFQRADVRIRVSGDEAARSCSRGELKMLAWSMIMAQGELLNQDVTYLVDDLLSELDGFHRQQLCQAFSSRNAQVVCTGIRAEELIECWQQSETTLFHVKQGTVEESFNE